MSTFATGQRVTFRESETGVPEPGTVRFPIEADDVYPHGGEYDVDLDDGSHVIAWHTELSPA
jgi:hypothetical protein